MSMRATGDWPELWWDLPLAVMDVETTGFDAGEDRVIEIGIVHMVRGEVVESWGQLVDPRRDIPEAVINLTGIKPEDVAGQPTFDQIAAEVAERLSGRGIVAYNLPFDRKFVTAELERAGLGWPERSPTFDPLIFARQFHREEGSKKLGEVAARLGIDLVEAHRAVDDATTAGYVLYAFREQLPPRLADLLVLQAQWERQQAADMSQRWRRSQNEESSSWLADDSSATIGLGPGYVYGSEHDPLRALYSSVPEARRE